MSWQVAAIIIVAIPSVAWVMRAIIVSSASLPVAEKDRRIGVTVTTPGKGLSSVKDPKPDEDGTS